MEPKTIRYLVTGLKPVYGRTANALLAALDLGITGAFTRYQAIATVTLAPDATPEQIAAQPQSIKLAFETQGFEDVTVERMVE